MIYKLVLAPQIHHAVAVDLYFPNPPSKSLLLASHRIHDEAYLLYEDAYKKYWETTQFEVVRPFRAPKIELKIADHDLDLIRHIRISGRRSLACNRDRPFCSRCCVTWTVMDPRGLWRSEREGKHHEILGNQSLITIGFLVFTPDAVDSNIPAGVSPRWSSCRVYRDEQEAKNVILNLQEVVPMSQQIRRTIRAADEFGLD